MRNFDFNLLKVLNSLLTTRSVTRTAAEMKLSAGAISHALNRLREEFDDPLLVRDGQNMHPTALALQISPLTHDALYQVELFLNAARQKSLNLHKTVLKICCHELIEILLIAPLFDLLQQNNIHVEIITITANTRENYINDMHSRKIDLLIDTQIINERSFRSTRIATANHCIICSKSHPRYDKTITVDELAQESLVGNNNLFSYFDETGLTEISDMQVSYSSPHIFSRYYTVANSELLLLASEPAAHFFKKILPIKILKSPFNYVKPLHLYLTYHRSLHNNTAVKIFSAALHDYIEKNAKELHVKKVYEPKLTK